MNPEGTNRSTTNTLRILVILAIFPSIAYANMVWPALIAESTVSSIPIIVLSLVLEFFVVKKLFAKDIKTSALITLVINIVSGLIGLVLRPLSGLAWELTLGSLVMWLFSWGTFNPIA